MENTERREEVGGVGERRDEGAEGERREEREREKGINKHKQVMAVLYKVAL